MIEPRFLTAWPALAAFTARVDADRASAYPRLVAAGRMTQTEADDGLRVARALAALLRAVVANDVIDTSRPVHALGASWNEMRDAAHRIASNARAAADRDPALAARADLAASLHDSLAPFSDALPRPHIVVLYETEQAHRRRSQRKAA